MIKKAFIRIRSIILARLGYKIFCISMQRSGTTSVGDFYQRNGLSVARWPDSNKNKWTEKWYNGDYEAILKSSKFKNTQVFEDDPFWVPEFYKYLYHKFPKSRFVLFTRDSHDWFKSMISHSNGATLGNTEIHCKLYRREDDLFKLIESGERISIEKTDNLLSLQDKKEMYINIYDIRNKEIKRFFSSKKNNRLFHADLYDQQKWSKLAQWTGMRIINDEDVHSNKSEVV